MHSVVRSLALKFCIPFGIHVCLALPLLWTRMQSPFWWPILCSLPVWCYLQYRSSRGNHRTGRLSAALYCGAVLLIPAAIIRDDAWLSLFALWLLMAYLAAIAVNRRGGSVSLTISLVWLLLAGLPPAWTEWLAESATGWLSRLLVIRSLQAGGRVCTFALDYAVFWFTAPIEDASRADSPQKNPVTEW